MNEGTLALLVPFAFFLLIGVIVWTVLHFRHKSNIETQETIRRAVDQGNQLSPELIEQLGNFRAHPKRDVRVGTMWIAIAIGLALMGLFVPDPSNSALQGLLATAAIPLMIGVAYLAMYCLTVRDKQA